MKSLKKILPFLTALAMMLSSAACGGNETSSATDSSSDRGENSHMQSSVDSYDSASDEESNSSSSAEEAQEKVNAALKALSAEDFTYAQLMGTDSLGRQTLPVTGTEKKYVGIFYFVLLGQRAHTSVYDIAKLLEKYGAKMDSSNPIFNMDADNEISPYTNFHYWGEPLYGYYKSTDKWVIRRHMELFMNAGIDFLYLDYSNGYTYPASVSALLDVILELQAEGYENVPTLAFMCPNNARSDSSANQLGSLDVVDILYDTYYKNPKYDSCWFRGDKSMNPYGNPLVIGRFSDVENEDVLDNLWLKELQWPLNMADDPDAFPWIEWNKPGTTQPNHNGVMNVSVAQHVNSWSSTSYVDSLTGAKNYQYRARGWTPDEPNKYGTSTQNVLAGSNFEWQWNNALAVKDELKMITVTGWNEWVAQKITYGNRDYAVFNDAFNCEFSRDAEMMKSGYGDNYYMQISRNIRDFLGKRIENTDNVALFERTSAKSVSESSALPARFLDIGGDSVARTATAVDASISYEDASNRNNILETRVGNDGEFLYVAVTTKEPVTSYSEGDRGWMTLYLDCGTDGWENYNFVVNRRPSLSGAAGTTSIERFTGTGSDTEDAGTAKLAVEGNTVLYIIPLSVIGVSSKTVIGIKATDNLQDFGNIDDFYISGDSAPLGRLNYAYKIA